MRHAYMQITWPDEQLDILAGQTSDVISPLYPSTLNYTVLWDAGNIGYRRPQIRLTKHITLGTGIDDVNTSDVNLADRTANRCMFGNVIYSLNKNTEIGFELSHWRTEYRGSGNADSIRAQSSLTYQFK